MDTTEVLSAILEAGLPGRSVWVRPDVVDQMAAAGVGATVTVDLGGKLPMPALSEQSQPLPQPVSKLPSNGKFQAKVAMARGLTINMGRSAISVDIAVFAPYRTYDPECFRSLGMEPTYFDYVVLMVTTGSASATQRRGHRMCRARCLHLRLQPTDF